MTIIWGIRARPIPLYGLVTRLIMVPIPIYLPNVRGTIPFEEEVGGDEDWVME